MARESKIDYGVLGCSDVDGQTDSQPYPAAEKVMSVGLTDKLAIAWGAVVSQKVGTSLAEFTVPLKCTIILFVNRGKLSVTIDGKPFTALAGQSLIVNSNETCVGTEPHQTELLCQWLSLIIDRPRRSDKNGCIQVSRVTDVGDPSMVMELFRLLTEEFHNHQSAHPGGRYLSNQSSQLLLLSLLSRLHPSESEELPASNALMALAERGRDYMRANSDKPSTIADVAKYLECSDGYLRTAFRHTYGYSPSSFLLRVRMHRARYLLSRTRVAIDQVSKECGYNSPGYFARVFTRENGVTPSHYRISHSHQYVTQGI